MGEINHSDRHQPCHGGIADVAPDEELRCAARHAPRSRGGAEFFGRTGSGRARPAAPAEELRRAARNAAPGRPTAEFSGTGRTRRTARPAAELDPLWRHGPAASVRHDLAPT